MLLIAVTPYRSIQIGVVSGGTKYFETSEVAFQVAKSLARRSLQPKVTGNNANRFTVCWDESGLTKTPSLKSKQEPQGSLPNKTGHIETKANKNLNPIPIPSKGNTTEGTTERKCVDCGNKIPSARIEQYPKAEHLRGRHVSPLTPQS